MEDGEQPLPTADMLVIAWEEKEDPNGGTYHPKSQCPSPPPTGNFVYTIYATVNVYRHRHT